MPSRRVEGSFRLNIDGHWTAEELAALMRSLEDIYNLASILGSRRGNKDHIYGQMFPIDRRSIRKIALEISQVPPLVVRQFRYSSPGFADLLGAGKAIKHVKDFIIAVTDRALETKQRRLDNETRRIANEKAVSDLHFSKKEREAAFVHDQQMRHLAIAAKKLDNLKLTEDLQAATLTNLEREVTIFSASLSRLMREKELSAEDQSKIIHWIGTRMHPVAELAERGKLINVEELPAKID